MVHVKEFIALENSQTCLLCNSHFLCIPTEHSLIVVTDEDIMFDLNDFGSA